MKRETNLFNPGVGFIFVSLLLAACEGDSGRFSDNNTGTSDNIVNGGEANIDGGSTTPPALTEPPTLTEAANLIDVSEASIVSSASKVTGGTTTRSGNDFSFPVISDDGINLSMAIPNDPLPRFAARRTARAGSGNPVGFGDAVILKYDMFSWTTGDLVESSSQFDTALTVNSGVSQNVPIPEFLSQSLAGRSLGDVVQIILPAGAEDLPDYFDSNDAYVVLVELM